MSISQFRKHKDNTHKTQNSLWIPDEQNFFFFLKQLNHLSLVQQIAYHPTTWISLFTSSTHTLISQLNHTAEKLHSWRYALIYAAISHILQENCNSPANKAWMPFRFRPFLSSICFVMPSQHSTHVFGNKQHALENKTEYSRHRASLSFVSLHLKQTTGLLNTNHLPHSFICILKWNTNK